MVDKLEITSSPSIVRRAIPEDEPSIWKLFYMLHEENGAFPTCDPKVKFMLDRVLNPHLIPPNDTGVRGYMGVIGPVNNIEAFCLLVLGSYWYTDAFMLEELANFTHPDHRKSKHAETLLQWTKMLSDKLEIPLTIGIISNVRTEAKVRLYRRHFPYMGGFFVYNRELALPTHLIAQQEGDTHGHRGNGKVNEGDTETAGTGAGREVVAAGSNGQAGTGVRVPAAEGGRAADTAVHTAEGPVAGRARRGKANTRPQAPAQKP